MTSPAQNRSELARAIFGEGGLSSRIRHGRRVRSDGSTDIIYQGWIENGQWHVYLEDEMPLDPRLDLVRHSILGFAWGYGGSGPSQLALALCAHALQDDVRALRVYQEFKWRVITTLDREWMLERDEVLEAIADIENER